MTDRPDHPGDERSARQDPLLAHYDPGLITRARESYEAACERLRYHTKAAWVTWEDLDYDGKVAWIEAVRTSEP